MHSEVKSLCDCTWPSWCICVRLRQSICEAFTSLDVPKELVGKSKWPLAGARTGSQPIHGMCTAGAPGDH